MSYYRTRISIVEDNPSLNEAFRLLIENSENYEVVGSYLDCESAIRNLPKHTPDIILMDLSLPGMSGIDGIRKIKDMYPDIKIVVVTVHENSELVFDALVAGADGYITKSTDYLELINSVREVMEGGAPMSSKIANMVIKSFQRNRDTPLTKRETEVLHHFAHGKTYSYIADELNISRETVKSHIKNIYSKLQVNNKSDAIKIASEKRYI